MWEHVADKVTRWGGEIHMGRLVERIVVEGERVVAVETVNAQGERERFEGDYFFSTMPMRELVRALEVAAPRCPRMCAR